MIERAFVYRGESKFECIHHAPGCVCTMCVCAGLCVRGHCSHASKDERKHGRFREKTLGSKREQTSSPQILKRQPAADPGKHRSATQSTDTSLPAFTFILHDIYAAFISSLDFKHFFMRLQLSPFPGVKNDMYDFGNHIP